MTEKELQEMEDRTTEALSHDTTPTWIDKVAVRDVPKLIAEVRRLQRFKAYWDDLYGQGLEIANWHQNGETEPFDNFYDGAVIQMEEG